jgi:predicted transposase/invertase (TIGR01784 family)
LGALESNSSHEAFPFKIEPMSNPTLSATQAMTSNKKVTGRYLDPKIDLAFKRLFGEHADLLISLLNALMPLPADAPIESIEYLPAESIPEIPALEKYSIVDVRCRDKLGRFFIVEMQMLWSADFKKRMLFSGTHAYVRQLGKGQSFSTLEPVYALALINAVFDRDSPDYYHHYKIVKQEDSRNTIPGLEFVFIELPKFDVAHAKDGTNALSTLWLRFLNEVGIERDQDQSLDPSLHAQPEISKAIELMQIAAFNMQEIQAYDKTIDSMRNYRSLIDGSHQKGKAEGLVEGIAIGEEKGKAEGITIGEEKGKREAALHIARQMLAAGLNAVDVARITGIDRYELPSQS